MNIGKYLRVKSRLFPFKIIYYIYNIVSGNRNRKAYKLDLIKNNILARNYDVFIETGTYLGDTTWYFKNIFNKIYTIEIEKDLYLAAVKRFKRYKNIKVINGDSGQEIRKIIGIIESPSVFWLDAHASGGVTTFRDAFTPIKAEIGAILGDKRYSHMIFIDDVGSFNGKHSYPEIKELKEMVEQTGRYILEPEKRIIIIKPK